MDLRLTRKIEIYPKSFTILMFKTYFKMFKKLLIMNQERIINQYFDFMVDHLLQKSLKRRIFQLIRYTVIFKLHLLLMIDILEIQGLHLFLDITEEDQFLIDICNQ